MLKLTVSQDGSGDFASISEAVLAVPYELEAEIRIGPGIYREKLVCEKRALTLRGAGADATTLIFGDGGKLPHPDGRPTHTFRSYTAFFSGGSVTVEDLTIANNAGPGSAVGQAIAAYVDAEKAVFRRVRLLGNQDTLFCAPLPEAEREKDGFLGPRKFAPRRPSAQYYQSCEIAGDIDFIFGGADALFEQCILRTVDNHLPHSYITAPSGSANGLGFVFWDCDFVSDCLGAAACAMVDAALCCRGQEKPALAFAAFTGAALCAADPSLAPAAVGLCCGTAAAVLLVPGRRAETLAACAGGCVLGVLCVPAPGTALPLLLSAGLGLAAPAFFPKHWLTPVPEAPAPPEEPPRLSAAATRLEAVAESLSSLAETVNAVYDAFPRRCDTFRWVIDNTHDSLCFNCGRRETCWKQEYTATLEGMNALRPILEQQGHLQASDLPGQLSRCIHPAALCAAANRSFALYRSRKEAHVHAEAMRTALTEQYSAMADALSVLSEQLGRPGNPEPYKSGRVAAFFASLGTPPLECAVTLDDLGRARAAVTLPRTRFSSPELAALAQETGRICRRDFDPPQVLSCKGMTTLLFCEKPALRAVFGTAGTAAKGTVSGDAVQQFCSPAAAQMILCDGMGTGRPAAVDGSLAAELTARLLKAGFTAELAARLVNVALALKSDEESGATLDLISVDLYTGTARIFKAGAAPGFLVHGGRARPVGDISLPIGILGGVNGQSRVVHLAAGDYAVLVSDGLLVDGPGWVAKQLELSAAAGDPPEKVARILVETARARAEQTGRPDDITAAVLRLEPCGH